MIFKEDMRQTWVRTNEESTESAESNVAIETMNLSNFSAAHIREHKMPIFSP